MEFVELSEKDFEKTQFTCGSFLQSIEMYRRYVGMDRETYLVGVKSRGKIVATGLILARNWHFGKKIFRVAGGWLLDYDAKDVNEVLTVLTKGARDFCKRRGGMVLEISPNIVSQPRDLHNQVVSGTNHLQVKKDLVALGYKYLGEYEQAKWVFILDLQGKTPDELFKEFRTTHRQLIRKAEREGVRVRELKDDELGILKEMTAEAGARHGFRDPEAGYYLSMKKYFGKKVKFVVAEAPRAIVKGAESDTRDYIPVAASMFVNDGREMVYLYSGSIRRYQRYNGSYLIQWTMIQEAIKSGCTRYNFYGVRPVEGDGVYLFKQGFRGHVEELLGTFALPLGWLGRLYLSRLKAQEIGQIQ